MYKLKEKGVILTKEDGTKMSIPEAEGNRHWVEYMAWLEEGNTPEPMDVVDSALEDASVEIIEAEAKLMDALADLIAGKPLSQIKVEFASTVAKRANAKAVLGGQ